MFEALLSPLLLRLLGQYVEDLPREQLRVALWSGVVRLEHVRLRPGAFDHLRLPFAVREGTVAILELKVRAAYTTRPPPRTYGAYHFKQRGSFCYFCFLAERNEGGGVCV